MKIRVLSDLHVDIAAWEPPSVDADVVVIAGDIRNGTGGFNWARTRFPDTEVICVLGNHELYGFGIDTAPVFLRQEASRLGVTLLDCNECVLDGIRFIGATLWTDFRLFADRAKGMDARQREAVFERTCFEVERSISDFSYISAPSLTQLSHDLRTDRLTALDLIELHQQQRAWLRQALARPFAGRTVVVTHHAPSARSVEGFGGWPGDPRAGTGARAAAYASNLTDLFGPNVGLWIHGHVHASLDYVDRGTRVVCNSRGDGRAPWSADVPDALVQASGLSHPPGSTASKLLRPGANLNFNPELVIEL